MQGHGLLNASPRTNSRRKNQQMNTEADNHLYGQQIYANGFAAAGIPRPPPQASAGFNPHLPATNAYPERSSPYSLSGDVIPPYNPLPGSDFGPANRSYPEPGGVFSATQVPAQRNARSLDTQEGTGVPLGGGGGGGGYGPRGQYLGTSDPLERLSKQEFRPSLSTMRQRGSKFHTPTPAHPIRRPHLPSHMRPMFNSERLYASPNDPSLAFPLAAQDSNGVETSGTDFSRQHVEDSNWNNLAGEQALPAPARRHGVKTERRSPSTLRHAPYVVPPSSNTADVRTRIERSNASSNNLTSSNRSAVDNNRTRNRTLPRYNPTSSTGSHVSNYNQALEFETNVHNSDRTFVPPYSSSSPPNSAHGGVTSPYSEPSTPFHGVPQVEEANNKRSKSPPPMWSLEALIKSQESAAQASGGKLSSSQNLNTGNSPGKLEKAYPKPPNLSSTPGTYSMSSRISVSPEDNRVSGSVLNPSLASGSKNAGIPQRRFRTSLGDINTLDLASDPVLQELAEDQNFWSTRNLNEQSDGASPRTASFSGPYFEGSASASYGHA